MSKEDKDVGVVYVLINPMMSSIVKISIQHTPITLTSFRKKYPIRNISNTDVVMSSTDMISISLYSEGPSTYITAGKWTINGELCITLHT